MKLCIFPSFLLFGLVTLKSYLIYKKIFNLL
nr:MAG TPA: hypothetical protein [Caudoviricetes sp.]